MALLNVIVVGGSYVGSNVAQKLAAALPATHRVLLIEQHSHFHHLFAFPRFAVVPNHEHKAFVPYTGLFSQIPSPHNHSIIRAKVTSTTRDSVTLDRPWNGVTEIPYAYLVIATGTRLSPPGNVAGEGKTEGVEYFKAYQEAVRKAKRVVIVGGGAVGVQMATDIADFYGPGAKKVTLVHSRDRVMPGFDGRLHGIIVERCKDLGIDLVLGSRAIVPPGGFPVGYQPDSEVVLTNGTHIPADLIIPALGQTPNTSPFTALSPHLLSANGFISVRPTLQLAQEGLEHIFALGDVADTGAHKAARPGGQQAEVVVKNVLAMVEGREMEARVEVNPAAIHMSLGMVKNVVFANPPVGSDEPRIIPRVDGTEDLGVERQWINRNVNVVVTQDYHL